MAKNVSPAVKELYVAYSIYIEAALQYQAGIGSFRRRAEPGALIALKEAMQYALKRLLAVAVVERGKNIITLQLPAEGYRDDGTDIGDFPRYAILDGPQIAKRLGAERIPLEDPEAGLYLHTIDLKNGRGQPPLFGHRLPFDLAF